jgi:hypothetical protein
MDVKCCWALATCVPLWSAAVCIASCGRCFHLRVPVWAKSRRPSDLWRPARVGRRSAVVLLHFVSLDQYNQQCFSLVTNQRTVLSATINQRNEQGVNFGLR